MQVRLIHVTTEVSPAGLERIPQAWAGVPMMLVRGMEAQDGVGIVRVAQTHLHETPSRGFARTNQVVRQGIVVQGSIALAVFLVVEGDRDRVGCEQVGTSRQWRNSVHDAIGPFAPKLEVLASDLGRASDSGARWRVFADSQEKEEREDCQIRQCLVLGAIGGSFMFHDIFCDRNWQRKLGLGCRIFIPVAVVKASERWAEFGATNLSSGVAAAGQNKGLGDMAQGCGNGLAPNLFAVAKSARTDSGSESHEHVGVLCARGSNKEGVEVEAPAPRGPVAPVGGSGSSVHRGMGNFCP